MKKAKAKAKFAFPLIIFFIITFFLWRGLQLDPHKIPSPLIGKSVPKFSAPSLFHPGDMINEHIFLRHVSVLNVFATWCVACHDEHAILLKLHQQDPSVQIVGLAFKDKQQDVKNYLKKSGNPFSTVINDKNGDVGINLGVYGTPETFVIDQRGVIRNKIIGPISPEILNKELLPMLRMLKKAW